MPGYWQKHWYKTNKLQFAFLVILMTPLVIGCRTTLPDITFLGERGSFFSSLSSLNAIQGWFWTVSLYIIILAFISNLNICKTNNSLENINCLPYQIFQGKSGENVVNYSHIIIFMWLESHRSQVLKGHSTWIWKGFLFSSLLRNVRKANYIDL